MNPGVVLRDPSYPALKRYVLDHTGLAYYANRDEDFASRIARRLTARGASDQSYLEILTRDPLEVDCLVGELTIGETYFFRQQEQFDLLRDRIVPELLERNRLMRSLRIWSAGCATGAEPYTVSLLLACEFEAALTGWDVSILATDINMEFLAQARAALFRDWALREMPPELRARCFRQQDGAWALLPRFRKGVTFRYHNLAAAAPPAPDGVPFDLILCRNVLIYFSREAMREVAIRFYENLTEGGWLLVGHAEPNAQIFGMFETKTGPAGTIYRKGPRREPQPIPNPAQVSGSNPAVPKTFDSPLVEWLANPSPMPQVEPVAAQQSGALAKTLAVDSETLQVDDIRLLADSGRWEAARESAGKLVAADPLNASAQFTLGLILEHAGYHDEAGKALRRAIYLDRRFALAHYHLGAILESTGDAVAARRSFRNVLRVLSVTPASEPLPHGDGITGEELRDLAKMHLELLAE